MITKEQENDVLYRQKKEIESQPINEFIDGIIRDQIEFFGSDAFMVLAFIITFVILIIIGATLKNDTPDEVVPVVAISSTKSADSIRLASLIMATEIAVKTLRK